MQNFRKPQNLSNTTEFRKQAQHADRANKKARAKKVNFGSNGENLFIRSKIIFSFEPSLRHDKIEPSTSDRPRSHRRLSVFEGTTGRPRMQRTREDKFVQNALPEIDRVLPSKLQTHRLRRGLRPRLLS